MAVPNIFASATSAIPLSQLDTNFATAITLGNTAVYLGNTTTSLGNVTLTNVTISSGNVTITGANVSGTANVSTLIVTGNQTSLGNVAITGNISANIATFGAGSNTAPSITTTGDTNTGIFFPAADSVATTVGGVEGTRLTSTGLGIGVTPQARLNVQYADSAPTASGTISSGVVFQYAAGGVALNMGSSSDGYVYFNSAFANNAAVGQAYRFYQGATQAMTLDASGNLLVGQTTSVGAKVQIGGFNDGSYASSTGLGVFGNSHFQNGLRIGALAGAGSRTVTADANGTLSASSDSSLKQEVDVPVAGLAEIMQVQPKAYKWLDDIEARGDTAAVEIGFFADQVAPIIPSAAPMGNNGKFGFYDRSMIAALTKAIQEQQSIITQLQTDVEALKNPT